MKIDDDLIHGIPRISLRAFLQLYLNFHLQLTQDDKLFYLHLCELFDRPDLAKAIDFIGQLNQPLQLLPQATLISIYAELRIFNGLPIRVIQDSQQEFDRLNSLPKFATLTDHGKKVLMDYLRGHNLNHPETIIFARQYDLDDRILSLIETCGDPNFLHNLTKLNLTSQQTNALALNPLYRKLVFNREVMQRRSRDDLIRFYFSRNYQDYYLRILENNFFVSKRNDYAVGHLYRTYLLDGKVEQAERLLNSQRHSTKLALRRYAELMPRTTPLVNQHTSNFIQDPKQFIHTDFFRNLPLETRISLRAISKEHRASIQPNEVISKTFEPLFKLGNRYQEKLNQFRKLNSDHLYYLTNLFKIKMFLGVLMTEIILRVVPTMSFVYARLLFNLFFLLLFSDFHDKKYPFNLRDPVGLSVRKQLADDLFILAALMLEVAEKIQSSPNEPWSEYEVIRFKQELIATLVGVGRFRLGMQTTAVTNDEFKTIFTAHPESHLYITYANRFFKQDFVGPYYRMLKRLAVEENSSLHELSNTIKGKL